MSEAVKSRINIDSSKTLSKYKEEMLDCLELYTDMDRSTLSGVVDFSINKRLHNVPAVLDNNYEKKTYDVKKNGDHYTLLEFSDYIASREPIVTAHGTLFKKHGTVPNPMGTVIQQFLDKRVEDKDMMLSFPKGSEQYEKYNLFQQLDKIDANGGKAIAIMVLSTRPAGSKVSVGLTKKLSGKP